MIGACSSERVTSEAERSGVVILGDSLSAETNEEFAVSLPDARLDAYPGRTMATPFLTDTGLDRVESIAETSPAWWVIALGTNDAGYAAMPPEALARDVTALLGAIDPAACVLWVLPAIGGAADPASIERVRAFADIVRPAVAARECGATADWGSVVSADSAVLDADGVHLNQHGETRYAEFIASALAAAESG